MKRQLRDNLFTSAAMLILLLTLFTMLLTGCTSQGEQAKSFLDRVEWDENECGTFEMEGTLDLNPIPLMSTNVHVRLEKVKQDCGVVE